MEDEEDGELREQFGEERKRAVEELHEAMKERFYLREGMEFVGRREGEAERHCPNCLAWAKEADQLEYRAADLSIGSTAYQILRTGRAPWRLIRTIVKEKIATQWRILLFNVRSRCPGLRPRS